MTTPFTPTEMAAQESAALAHGDLLASRASTAASAALEHEAGRDYALTPLHPALIPGCRVAYVAGEQIVTSGGVVSAVGDRMGGVAMLPATVASTPKRQTLGLRDYAQDYTGAVGQFQMLIPGGITALFGGAADWSLYIVARLNALSVVTPILWESGSSLRVYIDGPNALVRFILQTSAGSQSFSWAMPAGLDYGAGGPGASLLEFECRAQVLTVRVGVAVGSTSLIASQAIAGTPSASSAVVRVGTDNASAFATMYMGAIAAFNRALSDAELFRLRGWAVQEFGAAVANAVVAMSSAPTVSISGAVTTGGVLTATEGGSVTSRQWQRGSVYDGVGSYSACGGSDSGTTYTPVKADFGYSITCLTTGPGGSTRSNALIYSAATVSACVEQLDIGALSDGGVAALTGTKAGWAFTQGTGSKQPVKAANALNSLPGITADGSDDFLSASVNLTSYSALRIVAAVVDTTGASVTSVIVEHTASFGSNDGAFALGTYFDGVTSDTLGAGARGSGAAGFTRAGESLASACVISSNFDTSLSAGSSFIRKNGSALSTTAVLGTCGAGAFANASMYLFMRAGTSLPWAGTVGRKVLFLSGAAQDATLTDAEYYVMNGNGL